MGKKAKSEIDDIFASPKSTTTSARPPSSLAPPPPPTAAPLDAQPKKKRKRKRTTAEEAAETTVETIVDTSTAIERASKQGKKSLTADEEAFVDSRGTTSAYGFISRCCVVKESTGRKTEDGLPIYDAKELRIGEGGGASARSLAGLRRALMARSHRYRTVSI